MPLLSSCRQQVKISHIFFSKGTVELHEYERNNKTTEQTNLENKVPEAGFHPSSPIL
jgi:hypothetical protein